MFLLVIQRSSHTHCLTLPTISGFVLMEGHSDLSSSFSDVLQLLKREYHSKHTGRLIPLLQERLSEKEHQLTELTQKFSNSKQLLSENLHQASLELRRQYEAIDAALETLHSIQSIVLQCPPLAKLQRDLEETNFQCASSLPIMMPDLNANAALATINTSTNIVPHNPINGTV
uniref:Uncharacterized protein n=1 Tax=Timema poppense TaxID=170557 RepID=A0A7R9DBT9_TIMPO|nr:unnamed protein product [Timema poppensis]